MFRLIRRMKPFDGVRSDADPSLLAFEQQNAAIAARVAGLILSLGVALALRHEEILGWLVVLVICTAAAVAERLLPDRPARFIGPVEGAAVALATWLPATSGSAVFIYLLIPPAAAGLRHRVVWAAVTSAAQAVVLVAGAVLFSGSLSDALVWSGTSLVLGLIGGLSAGHLGQAMTRIYASAASAERLRLSRELHDGIAQDLAVLGYRVDLMLLDDARPIDRAELAAIADDIRRVLQETRWSIHDLRGGRLPEVGLGTALADHVRRSASAGDMTAHLKLTEGNPNLPTAVQLELLRIGQEAVTNARKHSGARNLWVELDLSPAGALLRVADDGRNGNSEGTDHGGYGLAIMRERARSIGAELSYRPRPGGGTVVETRLVLGGRGAGNRLVAWPRTHSESLAGEEVPR